MLETLMEDELKKRKEKEITEEIIKGRGDRVVHWVWMLCNIAFESGIVPEDWRSVDCSTVQG